MLSSGTNAEDFDSQTMSESSRRGSVVEANGDLVADSFEKALNEGYVGPCTAVVIGDSTATKLRLGRRDVTEIHAQAIEHGLSHQTYLKMTIHEALRNAEASGAFCSR